MKNEKLMQEALRILWTILTDNNFVSITIQKNISTLREEFPALNLDHIPNQRELIRSNESWKRVLGALLYANAINVLIQISEQNIYDVKYLYFASIYAWQRSLELSWLENTRALKAIIYQIIKIYANFKEFRESTVIFMHGIVSSFIEKDRKFGIRILALLIIGLIENKFSMEAKAVIDGILKRLENNLDETDIVFLLTLKERILYGEGKFNDAERVLDDIEKMQKSMESLIERAKLKYAKGEYLESLSIVNELNEVSEKLNLDRIYLRISSLYKLRRYNEALEEINKALKVAPKKEKIKLLIDKASILIETNEYQEAIKILEDTIKLLQEIDLPSQEKNFYLMKIFHGLGTSYASVGENFIGKNYLLKALTVSSSLKNISRERAMILLRLVAVNINIGNIEDAQKYIADAETLINELENRDQLERIIRNLKKILVSFRPRTN